MSDNPSMAPVSSRPGRTLVRQRPRRGLVIALLVLGSLAAFAASFAIWLNRQALSTDGWTQTSSDLIANRQIRTAVGDYAVQELFARTNVAKLVHSALPAALADPALTTLRQLGRRLAAGILGTGTARTVWIATNRQAQRQLLEILSRDRRGGVTLNLEPLLLDLIKALNSSAPVQALPGGGQQLFGVGSTGGGIPILRTDQVDKARAAVNAIRGLTVVLSIAAIVLFAAAIAAARGWRAGAVARVGGCLIAVGALVLLARQVTGPALADALVPTSTGPARPATEVAWMIGSSTLRDTAVLVLAGGTGLLLAGLAALVVSRRRG